MDLMESYECHACVPGGASAVNINLHAGGFHLYPHIHGTGGSEFLNKMIGRGKLVPVLN
jgi:hypothetical protein